jgi:ABC-type multidrug transport system fused ATPase/permease subunit
MVFHRPVDPEALARAIWAANAEEFVRELPQGLDTMLGDRGVRLSGARERIAIARAIYGRPTLLVLDEATSALDSEAEREVQKAMERIGREMTIIAIAHRLPAIVHADRILALSRGRVEAVGPHAHVLETILPIAGSMPRRPRPHPRPERACPAVALAPRSRARGVSPRFPRR